MKIIFCLLVLFGFVQGQNIIVTQGEKTTSHTFFALGDRTGLSVDGVEGGPLSVVAGNPLVLQNDAPCTDSDLYISLSPDGGPSALAVSEITAGVVASTTPVCGGATITFTPTENFVGVVYYADRKKSYSGGFIEVISGKTLNVIDIYITAQLRTSAHPNQAGIGGTTANCPEGPHPVAYAVCSDASRTDCVEGRELNLEIGNKYVFHNDKCGHPFYIADNAVGKLQPRADGSDRITQGVTVTPNPDDIVCGNNVLEFVPSVSNLGAVIYYQCEVHCRMGWKMNILQQSFCGKYTEALSAAVADSNELISLVVADTVTAALANPTLLPFFNNGAPWYNGASFPDFTTDTNAASALSAGLVAFFGQEGVLSCRDGSITGPAATVADLGPIHANMPIDTNAFDIFNGALLSVLEGYGVVPQDLTSVADLLESTKPLICNEPDCKPDYVPSLCDVHTANSGAGSSFEWMLYNVIAPIFFELTAPSSKVLEFFDGTYNCIGGSDADQCNKDAQGERVCDSGTNTIPTGAAVSCIPDFTRAYDSNLDSNTFNVSGVGFLNDQTLGLASGLIAFFGSAFGCRGGGFPLYDGPTMAVVHQSMPIGVFEFDAFNDAVIAALGPSGNNEFNQAELDITREVLDSFKFDVCNQADCKQTFCTFYSNALSLGTQKELITTVLDGVFTDVLASPTLQIFFNGNQPAGSTDFTTDSAAYTILYDQLTDFFFQVLGCTDASAGPFVPMGTLAEVHQDLGIGLAAFNEFNDIIIAVMKSAGVEEGDLDTVRKILDNTIGDICFGTDCKVTGDDPNKPVVFEVGVTSKGPSAFFSDGFPSGYTIARDGEDPQESPPLYLKSGNTYQFFVPGSCFHPLYITADAAGGDGAVSALSGPTSPKGDGTACAGDSLTWKPTPADATAGTPLYYQCANHQKMGGPIYVDETPVNDPGDNEPLPTPSLCDKYTLALKNVVPDNKGLITAVVVDTFLAAIADARLVTFFDGSGNGGTKDFINDATNQGALVDTLVAFFGGVLGCTDKSIPGYTGGTLLEVHQNMPIFRKDFDDFNDALISVLASYGVTEEDNAVIRSVLDGTEIDVCTCCSKFDGICDPSITNLPTGTGTGTGTEAVDGTNGEKASGVDSQFQILSIALICKVFLLLVL